MSHPYYHACSSAKRFGGRPEDYLPIHTWFDESRRWLADFRHRAYRHHAEGIWQAEQLFGPTVTNSCGREVPTRHVAEQHVLEDLGCIPKLSDWLLAIRPRPWMLRKPRLLFRRRTLDGPAASAPLSSAPPAHSEEDKQRPRM